MAHHSSFPTSDEDRRAFDALFAAKESVGPTGRFPLGKLTPTDEGEIAIGIAHTKGKVVIDFGTPTAWIGFTPEQAEQIADTLREHAAMARA